MWIQDPSRSGRATLINRVPESIPRAIAVRLWSARPPLPLFKSQYPVAWPRVAGHACKRRFAGLMTTDTGGHRPDCLAFSHDFALADVAVAGLARRAGVQMCPVTPGDSRGDCIDTHPRDRQAGQRKCLQVQYCRFVLCNCRMARHACVRQRKCHLRSRIGIHMTGLANQPRSKMRFVTEWQRLGGRRVRCDIVRHCRQGSGGGLLRRDRRAGQEHKHRRERRGYSKDSSFGGGFLVSRFFHRQDFTPDDLLTASSMLLP